MDTLGVGIIGFGFIGKVHTYGYRNIPLFYDPMPVRTKLVGVADVAPGRAQQAALDNGFEFGTDDWRELIDRDDIHIIDICSPNSQHLEQILAALAAGKHVYCEKPLVVGDEEARKVAAALDSYRGTGQMTFQYRFFPATLRAKQLIDEGFLGNVISFRAGFLHSGSVDASKPMGWKQMKSECGGVLQDLGSHIIDLMEHLVGPFDRISAQTNILYPFRPNSKGEMIPVEADDHALMMMRLPNGAMGTIEASKIATGAEDELFFEIHGDQGALRYRQMDTNYLEAYDMRESEHPIGGQRGWRKIATVNRYEKPASGFPTPKFSVGWMRAHMHCQYTFLNAIATGQPAEPSLQWGLHLREILSVAEVSAETGQWMTLPQRTLASSST
jgi:predicted dehydrogenase